MSLRSGADEQINLSRNGVSRPRPVPSSPYNQSTNAVQRTPPIGDGQNMDSKEELSLMDKLKAHYSGDRSKTTSSSKIGFRVLFQFQVWTQLFMMHNYLIPFVFSEYDPWTRYYIKIPIYFITIMGTANWLATICYAYANDLPDFRDRPDLDPKTGSQNSSEAFGQDKLDVSFAQGRDMLPFQGQNGLEWTFCNRSCQRYRPPRAHHCDHCKTCILRRDHHCYLVGNCIGHYNQRYFIPLMMYSMIHCIIGNSLNLVYFLHHPECSSIWYDYLYPVAMLKMCLGLVSWQFCMLTFHFAMCTMFGLMATLYFFGALSLVMVGKTLFEIAKKVDIQINSTINANFRMVFGDYWFSNFFFPMVILFKQRHDGINYENIKIGKKQVKLNIKET